MEISTFAQLANIWPDLPDLQEKGPDIRKLKISHITGAERLEPPDRQFKLPESFPRFTLTGVPLGPFIGQNTSLTNFTYEGKFTQSIDTLLEFLEGNPRIKHVKLCTEFQPPNLRLSKRTSPISNTSLRHLDVRSDQEEDIKALVSYIRVQRTEGAYLHILSSDRVAIETIIPFIDAMYFNNDDPPTCMSYVHGTGIQFSGAGREPEGPDLAVVVHPSASTPFPLTFEHIRYYQESFPNLFMSVKTLILSMDEKEGEFDPTLFPALEHLTVREDENLPKTLSQLFSTPRSELPTKFYTIAFDNCPRSREFVEEFKNHSNGFTYE